MRQHSYFGTRKFKLLYFRNEPCYGNRNLYKDLLFVYLKPCVNKNSKNLAILTLQFDDVTVKTIYWTMINGITNFNIAATKFNVFSNDSCNHFWVR